MKQISVQQYVDSFGGYDKFFDEKFKYQSLDEGNESRAFFIRRAVDLVLSGNRVQGMQIINNLLQNDYWIKMNEYARKKGFKFDELKDIYNKLINSNVSHDEEFLLELNKLDNDVTCKSEGKQRPNSFGNFPFTVFDVASDELKNKKEFVLECIRTNYRVLEQISKKEWLNDYDFMYKVINVQPLAFEYLKDTDLFKSKELQLLAVSNDSYVIECIRLFNMKNNLVIDDDVVMTAVKSDYSGGKVNWFDIYNSKIISDKVKNNPEFLLYSVSKSYKMWNCIPENLKNDEKFKEQLFKLNPKLIIDYAQTKDEKFELLLKYDLDNISIYFYGIDDKFTDDLKFKFIATLQAYKEEYSSDSRKLRNKILSLIETVDESIEDDKDIAFAVLKNGGDLILIKEFFPTIYSQIFENKKIWLEALKCDISIFTEKPSFWDKESILYYLNGVSNVDIDTFKEYFDDSDIRALLVNKFPYKSLRVGLLTYEERVQLLKKDVIDSINPEKEISEYTYKFSLNENTALPEVEIRKFCLNDSISQQLFSYFPFIKDLYEEHDKNYDSVIEIFNSNLLDMRKLMDLSDYDNNFIFNIIDTNSMIWFYLPYEIQISPDVKKLVVELNPEMEKYISKYDIKKTI